MQVELSDDELAALILGLEVLDDKSAVSVGDPLELASAWLAVSSAAERRLARSPDNFPSREDRVALSGLSDRLYAALRRRAAPGGRRRPAMPNDRDVRILGRLGIRLRSLLTAPVFSNSLTSEQTASALEVIASSQKPPLPPAKPLLK